MTRMSWAWGAVLLLACGVATDPGGGALATNGESSGLVVEPAARKIKECTNRDLKADPSFCDAKVQYATATGCVKFTCVATACQDGFVIAGGQCRCPVGSKLVNGTCTESRCRTVGALQWCNDPDVMGEDCTTLCSDLRMTVLGDDQAWLQAQDTEAECTAIAGAFGIAWQVVYLGSYTNACIEYAPGYTPSLSCSTYVGCPANHRTAADANQYQLCPCVP